MYLIQLDGVPVISKKNRLKFGRGRTYKTKEVQNFEEVLGREGERVCLQPLKGGVSMEIEVTVPDKRRRDLQNFSDTICDSLNGIAYDDDCQIEKLTMTKSYGTEWKLTVRVWEGR